MKTFVIAASAACAMLAAPALAQAQTTFYANIGYAALSVDEDDIDANLGMIQGRIGAKFNPYFAVEGEAGFGIKDDSVEVLGVDVNVEVKHQFAAYAVLSYPVGESFEVFGRVGYTSFEVEASAGGGSASDSGSDAAYGLGVQGFFTANDGVRGEWTSYGDADAWSIAYVRKF